MTGLVWVDAGRGRPEPGERVLLIRPDARRIELAEFAPATTNGLFAATADQWVVDGAWNPRCDVLPGQLWARVSPPEGATA